MLCKSLLEGSFCKANVVFADSVFGCDMCVVDDAGRDIYYSCLTGVLLSLHIIYSPRVTCTAADFSSNSSCAFF